MIGGIDLQNRTLDYSARKANTQKNSILEKESFNDILKCTTPCKPKISAIDISFEKW